MKFYTILAMAAGALAAATPRAAVPSIDVLLYEDTSTTDNYCSVATTKTVTVQNGTCAFDTAGFNSYKVTAERSLPAGKNCFVFLLNSTTCGKGTLTAGLALNGTEINKCERARTESGVISNQLFFECTN